MKSSYTIFYHQFQQIKDTGIKYDTGGHILLIRFLPSVLNANHNQSAEMVSLDCVSITQPV